MPKFSILTPVFLHDQARQQMFARCIFSVINQTYDDWEHVIVNDGSRVAFVHPPDHRQVVIEQQHRERMIALNAAMKKATGEWFCFLDSDDEYLSVYLEAVSGMIKNHPNCKLFNFGSIHVHRNYGVTIRPIFEPAKKEVGHEIFRSGKIVNGTFVFHRSLYEDLGGFPDVTNCWDLRDVAFEEFPEIKELYKRVEQSTGKITYSELGNPIGQDYYYFYKLTRKYHSEPIQAYLYIVHPRSGHSLEV